MIKKITEITLFSVFILAGFYLLYFVSMKSINKCQQVESKYFRECLNF